MVRWDQEMVRLCWRNQGVPRITLCWSDYVIKKEMHSLCNQLICSVRGSIQWVAVPFPMGAPSTTYMPSGLWRQRVGNVSIDEVSGGSGVNRGCGRRWKTWFWCIILIGREIGDNANMRELSIELTWLDACHSHSSSRVSIVFCIHFLAGWVYGSWSSLVLHGNHGCCIDGFRQVNVFRQSLDFGLGLFQDIVQFDRYVNQSVQQLSVKALEIYHT